MRYTINSIILELLKYFIEIRFYYRRMRPMNASDRVSTTIVVAAALRQGCLKTSSRKATGCLRSSHYVYVIFVSSALPASARLFPLKISLSVLQRRVCSKLV